MHDFGTLLHKYYAVTYTKVAFAHAYLRLPVGDKGSALIPCDLEMIAYMVSRI